MGKRSKKRNNANKNINVSESNSEPHTAVSNEDGINVNKSKINFQNEESQVGTQINCMRDKKNKKTTLVEPSKNTKCISNKIIKLNDHDKSQDESIEQNTRESKGSIKMVKKKKHIDVTPEEVYEETVKETGSAENIKNTKRKRKKCINSENPIASEGLVKGIAKDTGKKSKNECKQNNEEEESLKEVVQQEIDSEEEEKPKKKKKRKIIAEEIVNDEDIDRYCDDLDEVHNQQYEDWVKLIEANLSANKKVKKY